MRKTDLALLVTAMVCAADVQADPVTESASDVAECRNISNPEVRLACFDAAVAPLVRALQATEQAASASTTPAVDAPERSRSDATASTSAPGSEKRTAAPSSGADRDRSSVATGESIPAWAAAPDRDEAPRSEQSNEFTATIVRIVRNQLGRHYFHTEDGAVWMQTQVEKIRAPESLPAEATFRRKLTGNPTIQFDISNRSYRVRRVE